MSYSFNTRCHDCEKRKDCSDHDHLRGAIDGLHMAGASRGHVGWGSVDLNCGNFVQKGE